MDIRQAGSADTPKVRALWEEGFGNEQPYTDWYFGRVYTPERTLLLEKDGQLLAALQTAAYDLVWAGQPLPAAYFVGVVTANSHRHQGYGHALMREAMNRLRQAGVAMALLYTDVPGFYAPLGFAHCYQLRRIAIPARPGPLPSGWARQELTDEAIRQLDGIYRQMTGSWNGYIRRSRDNWRNYLEEQRCDEGEIWLSPDAYLLWYKAKGQPEIRELGFGDKAALNSALAAAAALAAAKNLPVAGWLAPLAAPLPPAFQGSLKPYLMACRLDRPELDGSRLAAATRDWYRGYGQSNWINEMT